MSLYKSITLIWNTSTVLVTSSQKGYCRIEEVSNKANEKDQGHIETLKQIEIEKLELFILKERQIRQDKIRSYKILNGI